MEVAFVGGHILSRKNFLRVGAVAFLKDLLPYLSKKFEIEIFVGGKEREEFEFEGVKVHTVPGIRIPSKFIPKVYLPKLGISPDIMVFMEYGAPLSPNSGKRNIVVIHHLSQSFREENPELFLKHFGWLGVAYDSIEGLILNAIRKKVPEAILVSNLSEKYMKKLGFKTYIVGNGVEPGKYKIKEKEGYALYIGRLVSYKRVEKAIEIAKRAGIDIKIIGTGFMEKELRRKFEGDGVEFLGYVPEEEKIELLSRASFLVNFSAFEGFGITLVEAMGSGAVPVVSDIKAHRFVFSGREAGILAKSVEEAVNGIKYLVENTEEYRRRQREGRKLVEEVWNAKRVADAYIEVFENG